jgi:hypothetical protein
MLHQPSTPPRRAGSWDVLHEDDSLRVWGLREVVAVAWFEAPNADQLRALQRIAKQRTQKHPRGVWLYQNVVRGTPRFTDEVRAEVDRITRELTFPLGSSHVILAQGLAGAAARAFLSTALLVRKDRVPAKVFGDFESAATWMVRQLGVGWNEGELVELGRAIVEGTPSPAS